MKIQTHPPNGRAQLFVHLSPVQAPPPEEVDRLELKRDPEEPDSPPERHSSGKVRLLAGVALGLTAVGLVANAVMAPPPVQQEQVVGYAGDSGVSHRQTAQELLLNINQLDTAGHKPDDGRFGVGDLQREAADAQAPVTLQIASQDVLSDTLFMNSLDVAYGNSVDHVISVEDLKTFLAQEPEATVITFADLHNNLEASYNGSSAFDYLDRAQSGQLDGRFTRADVDAAAGNGQLPEQVRDTAHILQQNPNLYNAFDVAQARNSPNVLDRLLGHQNRDGVISHGDVEAVQYTATPEAGRQWTDAYAAALDEVRQGQTWGSDEFQGVYQTDRGNCATTAVIKLAMHHYGPRVVSFAPDGSGGYNVTMRDGFELHLTAGEMEAAATATHYGGTDTRMKSYSTLLFGSMAKRAQLERHEGAQTYAQALMSLNDGEHTDRVPDYLGLSAQVRRVSVGDVDTVQDAVVWGNGHAYYVQTSNGQTSGDRWGTRTEFQGRASVNEGKQDHDALTLQGSEPTRS